MTTENDLDRSMALARDLRQAIGARAGELRRILDLNQNPGSGDGSFDKDSWPDLRSLVWALESLDRDIADFLAADGDES